jgi:hypothetical protein
MGKQGFEKLKCPCCGKERSIDVGVPPFSVEQELLKQERSPWWSDEGWTIREARSGNLQWACSLCLKNHRAIIAKPEFQQWCDHSPYLAYFDVLVKCQDCQDVFTFSADEQKYWYEELNFWIQSRPNRCRPCRTRQRSQKRANQELSEQLQKIDVQDPFELAEVAKLYFDLGNSKKSLEFLRQARNRARKSDQIDALQKKLIELHLHEKGDDAL